MSISDFPPRILLVNRFTSKRLQSAANLTFSASASTDRKTIILTLVPHPATISRAARYPETILTAWKTTTIYNCLKLKFLMHFPDSVL
jgi:capsule polysaccharide export protein KpsE/RkpR